MRKALISNGKIVDIQDENLADKNGTPFPVHKDLEWVDCPDDCSRKWVYEDGEFIAPPAPATLTESEKWAKDIQVNDFTSRDIENIIDAMTETSRLKLDKKTLDKYSFKKELRNNKPD